MAQLNFTSTKASEVSLFVAFNLLHLARLKAEGPGNEASPVHKGCSNVSSQELKQP